MRTTRWPQRNSAAEWPGRMRLKRQRLARAWSRFLGRVPWEWFITLTFDSDRAVPIGQLRADRDAFWWFGQTSHLLRRPIAWVYAPERRPTGMWHVHALLAGGVARRDLNAPAAMWKARNGFVDIRRVSARFGAALYTTKQAALTGDVVLSDTLAKYRNCLGEEVLVPLFPAVAQE